MARTLLLFNTKYRLQRRVKNVGLLILLGHHHTMIHRIQTNNNSLASSPLAKDLGQRWP